MDRINRYNKTLCRACKISKTKRQRTVLFKKCSNDVIKALVDIAHNVLRGNIRLSSKTKSKLKKFKHQLRHLSNARSDLNSKKKYIIQKGGFLPFFAPLVPLLIKAVMFAGPAIAKGVLAGATGTAASAVANKLIQ